MKKLTSISYFEMPEGLNEAITYSEIDENGQIIAKNQKLSRIITNIDEISIIKGIMNDAQKILE